MNKDNKKSKHKLWVNEKNKHSKLSKAFNHQGIYEHKATSFYNLRWSNLQRSHAHPYTHTRVCITETLLQQQNVNKH